TTRSGTDLTVRLAQGSVIVQAAQRRSGHLYVVTSDCRVAVTGTVFGVSAGTKGSRVSVIEGEVRVAQASGETVLHPGQQVTTTPVLAPVRVQDDIAWSRDFERHLSLLTEMRGLEADLKEVRMPELRYSSNIVNRLPANTVMFASIPNLGNYFAEARTVFRERLAQSPQLRAWLDHSSGGYFDESIARLQAASQYFGDEVVIAAFAGESGGLRGPVFLAEEKRPGFAEFLRQQGARVPVESRHGMLAFSPDPSVTANVFDPPTTFSSTPLYARVAEAYRNGAGLLFAADLSRMQAPGMSNLQYVLGEQK